MARDVVDFGVLPAPTYNAAGGYEWMRTTSRPRRDTEKARDELDLTALCALPHRQSYNAAGSFEPPESTPRREETLVRRTIR
jgi:hypothetical protein